MGKDIYSNIKITEAYEMFGASQTDTIHFRCTPKLKQFIDELAKDEGLNIKDYLIKLVMNDYNTKYNEELEKLRAENREELLKGEIKNE